MQWWVFVPVIAMAFWPSVETRSIVNGTSLSCGDPKFKDSWIVEIHVKNRAVEAFCYGVLVSAQHVLTSHECLWTRKQFLGRQPEAKFPYLPNQPSINFKSNWQSNWAGFQDQYALALFELSQPLPTASNFTPICLPRLLSEEEVQSASAKLNPSEDEDCNDDSSESRVPGLASVEETEAGQFFLEGLRANTCPTLGQVLYLPVQSSRRWLEAALIEDSIHPFNDLVNGLCPHVTRWTEMEAEKLSCYKPFSLPGRISGLSKVKCDSWRLFESSKRPADHVQVQCNEAEDDGEILTLALSQISCRVVDCHLQAASIEEEAQWIPLSGLGQPQDCTQTEEEVRGCGSSTLSDSITTEEIAEEADTTLSPFFGTRSSAIVFNEASSEEAASASASSTTLPSFSRCPTQDPQQFCQFPFFYQERLRFECVTRDAERGPECQTDRERWSSCSDRCPLMKYHNHTGLLRDLEQLQRAAPADVSLFSLGSSMGGRELRGIRLGKNYDDQGELAEPGEDQDQALLRPLVKLVGNMHGNEPTGREMLIHLAKYIILADRYSQERQIASRDPWVARAAAILRNTDLWILPTMNPDGFARGTEGKCFGGNYAAGRTNEGRVDLNRNFPSWKERGKVNLLEGKEQETQLVMEWILKNPFVLSANFHDGAVLANYPYDDYRSSASRRRGGVSVTPDHDVFVHLAKTYASNHPYMEDTSQVCEHWGFFKDGITNGADWYEVRGGMQDFNYDFSNAMEITVEVSCCKYPNRTQLLPEWENNMRSLIAYVEQAQRGVRGYVRDEQMKPVTEADIQVRKSTETEWRGKNVTSDALGRYWRILLPGTYQMRAVRGYSLSPEQTVQITSSQIYRRVDFQLNQ